MIRYLDKVIKLLVLILPKMDGSVKTLKVKDKNNKLMYFHINDEKLLGKYKTVGTKIEELKNIELNALPVYYDRNMKFKIRTYGNKVYTKFCSLNVSEDDIECNSFIVFSIEFLLVYKKTNTTFTHI